jgi:NAD(P)-dependent dehydrogenase (short-subunit alcohol dehydrogenase family)
MARSSAGRCATENSIEPPMKLQENRNMTKIALITGGSRGLGANTAINIARQGGDVIITYHSNADAAARIVSEIEGLGRKAVALQLDTGSLASFNDFANALRATLKATWQRETFDHLVNNAGHGDHTLLGNTTEAQFDSLMNVHFKGVYFLTQTLAPMIADQGRIVNLSTGLTRFAIPSYSVYAAMKGAIEVLTCYWAKELGARGIAVNTVAPGAIETDFDGGGVRDNPELNKMLAGGISLGRVGVPDDIGPMIARLLSEDNRWINAQRIEVSGGQMI